MENREQTQIELVQYYKHQLDVSRAYNATLLEKIGDLAREKGQLLYTEQHYSEIIDGLNRVVAHLENEVKKYKPAPQRRVRRAAV